MNGRNRSYIMGVVGGYLIYLAYQLYQDPEGGMSPAMRILFIILFGLIGIGLLGFAVILWKNGGKEKEKQEVPEEKQDSLKN